jgi:cytochrome P450
MHKSSQVWDGIVLKRGQNRLERYRAGEKLDDFFQALMEDKNGQANNLQWGEILAEVNIMMNAGSVTTAIALANVMHQLLKQPEIMKRLQEEVDSVLDPDEVVALYDKVKHLPYLWACLDESLRLQPPTPPVSATIVGHYVPGNTTVSISALVAHRDESAFPDAVRYWPERWLGERGKDLQASFITFSAGARGYIGRNISYLEQAVLLARVVQRYDFAMPRGFEIQREETMNHILGPLPVMATLRNLEVL